MPRMQNKLGQAELEILRIVQEHQPVTVGDVARQVADDNGKARTTVATMVARLVAKGFLTRKKLDGKFHYSAKLSETELHRGLVQRFVENTLGGSLSPFVAYLVEQPNLSASEVESLQKLLHDLKPATKARHA
jgi:predicted transcriptional regulator